MANHGMSCTVVPQCRSDANSSPVPVVASAASSDADSMVPVGFELTILFSALGAVFGMLAMNKLPRHHHPIFNSDKFKGFSDDKFFISVESTDPKIIATVRIASFAATGAPSGHRA